MTRALAVLALLVLGAGVGRACPWQRHRYPPPPVFVYPQCPPPPPVIIRAPGPPPVVAETPPPAPAEPAAKTPAAREEFNPVALYERALPSCVYIVSPLKGGFAQGTGALIDVQKRYVLTTYHLVDKVDTVYCQFPVRQKDGSLLTDKKAYLERIPAGQALKGKVLYRDKARDLAILQLDKLPSAARALPMAEQSAPVGEAVLLISTGATEVFGRFTGEIGTGEMQDLLFRDGPPPLKIRAMTLPHPVAFNTTGPVIDRRGRLVAVAASTGGAAAHDTNRVIDVTEIRAFLGEKKVRIAEPDASGPPPGPDLRPPRKPAPGPPGMPPLHRDPDAPSTPEQEATSALQSAKLFKDEPETRAFYKAKLKQVIEKYPGTDAARQAQKLLGGVKK